MKQEIEIFSSAEVECMSYIGKSENTLWNIRKALAGEENKNAIATLFGKRCIFLKRGDNNIMDPQQCIKILNEGLPYASHWWRMMTVELTDRGIGQFMKVWETANDK